MPSFADVDFRDDGSSESQESRISFKLTKYLNISLFNWMHLTGIYSHSKFLFNLSEFPA